MGIIPDFTIISFTAKNNPGGGRGVFLLNEDVAFEVFADGQFKTGSQGEFFPVSHSERTPQISWRVLSTDDDSAFGDGSFAWRIREFQLNTAKRHGAFDEGRRHGNSDLLGLCAEFPSGDPVQGLHLFCGRMQQIHRSPILPCPHFNQSGFKIGGRRGIGRQDQLSQIAGFLGSDRQNHLFRKSGEREILCVARFQQELWRPALR